MPHSLYLGSALVKAMIWHHGISLGHVPSEDDCDEKQDYTPSFEAINNTLKYSTIEAVFRSAHLRYLSIRLF